MSHTTIYSKAVRTPRTRAGVTGFMRVTKRDWYANGGFRNSLCWRRQVRGVWHYYINAR